MDIFTRAGEVETDLLIVDCPVVAQATRDYDEYLEMLSRQGGRELRLSGIGLYSNGKKIAKLAGNLSLLRQAQDLLEKERFESHPLDNTSMVNYA